LLENKANAERDKNDKKVMAAKTAIRKFLEDRKISKSQPTSVYITFEHR